MDIDGNLSAHRTKPRGLWLAFFSVLRMLIKDAAAALGNEEKKKRKKWTSNNICPVGIMYDPSESLETGPGI